MRKILILSFSQLHKDPRVQRHIDYFLSAGWEVTACGLSAPPQKVSRFIEISSSRPQSFVGKLLTALNLKLRLFSLHYWSLQFVQEAQDKLSGQSFDVIFGNDAITMPLIQKIKGQSKTVIDLHEYAPEEFTERKFWKIFYQPFAFWLCRNFLSSFDQAITVCEPIAEKYQQIFEIKKPLVIENRAKFFELSPRLPVCFPIRMIHHGAALRSRQISTMIEVAHRLEGKVTLDLMLASGDAGYLEEIKLSIENVKNVKLIPPVATAEIIPFCNSYDIGFYILAPTNFNNLNALPNKFFEFIQSRLALLIGPSPAMAGYLTKFGNGLAVEDFDPETFIQRLSNLDTGKIQGMKEASNFAAKELDFSSSQAVYGDLGK